MSKDGIFGDWIAAFRKPAEDVDAEMAARISGASANRDALKKDFATPARTMGNVRNKTVSWQNSQSYKPGYYVDSIGVGTVASEKNSLESYIFWTEQELLKAQGKPYVSP